MSKAQLRTEIRLRRKCLDQASRQSMDQAIIAFLFELVAATDSLSLSAFCSFDGEPDLTSGLATLHQQGVQIALPVIDETVDEPNLLFRYWTPSDRMIKNRFGIDEPESGDLVSVQDLDMVLLPLIAFDQHGHRLGMGAGYYDRSLITVAGKLQPLRVGIAYETQRVSAVPTDSWDIRLHQVITENGRFTCAA